MKRNLKRVRFNGGLDKNDDDSPPSKEPNLASVSRDHNAQSFAMLDLRATKSVCCHLHRSCGTGAPCKDPCIGYLEYLKAANSFKLVFYDAGKMTVAQTKPRGKSVRALPVNCLLEVLQMLHQLTLAHTLAITTLQYCSTSWLPMDWQLHNLCYFTDCTNYEDNIVKELQSLHLSTQFPTETRATVAPPKKGLQGYGLSVRHPQPNFG
jgi:hypothetical protein